MKRIDNLSSGRVARVGWILVPAMIATVAVSGVVSRPAMGLDAARSMSAKASEQVAERNREALRARDFALQGGEARLDELRTAVVETIPAPISPLDLQGLMALAAKRAQLPLETIEIGPPSPSRFAVLEDSIVSSRVDVRGRGSLRSVVEFVDALRGAGLAVSIDDAVVARTRASERGYDVRLTLSFHHRVARGTTSAAENRGDS